MAVAGNDATAGDAREGLPLGLDGSGGKFRAGAGFHGVGDQLGIDLGFYEGGGWDELGEGRLARDVLHAAAGSIEAPDLKRLGLAGAEGEFRRHHLQGGDRSGGEG